VWAVGGSAPSLVAAWRSQVAMWIGRATLVVIAAASGAGLLRDGIAILN